MGLQSQTVSKVKDILKVYLCSSVRSSVSCLSVSPYSGDKELFVNYLRVFKSLHLTFNVC